MRYFLCALCTPVTQRGFIDDLYKGAFTVNPVDQWGKIVVMAMGFCRSLGALTHQPKFFRYNITSKPSLFLNTTIFNIIRWDDGSTK